MINVRTLQDIVDQCIDDSMEWFPEVAPNLMHHCLALAGEVGELCNVVKKVDRRSIDEESARQMLIDETVDVFIYLCNIAAVLRMDLEAEYDRKRTFNQRRFGREDAAVS
jgi:NTP pyrophosphatase (non-canonical NTP hydrolase)